ncbi:MAG: hypothetical protein QHH07_08390 [Sedimentisphaerales bacterium]|jgi:hypothetical protein|nr:hypothetical protein [Sedimentisphaerales bacterium]
MTCLLVADMDKFLAWVEVGQIRWEYMQVAKAQVEVWCISLSQLWNRQRNNFTWRISSCPAANGACCYYPPFVVSGVLALEDS